jgi:hypothetical protein
MEMTLVKSLQSLICFMCRWNIFKINIDFNQCFILPVLAVTHVTTGCVIRFSQYVACYRIVNKVPSGQIRSAREWYHWIGLGKNVPRYWLSALSKLSRTGNAASWGIFIFGYRSLNKINIASFRFMLFYLLLNIQHQN